MGIHLSLFSQKTLPHALLPFSFLFLLPFLIAFDDTLSHNDDDFHKESNQLLLHKVTNNNKKKILPVFKKQPFICMNTLELQQLRWHFTRKNFILYLFLTTCKLKKFSRYFFPPLFFPTSFHRHNSPSVYFGDSFHHTHNTQPCK